MGGGFRSPTIAAGRTKKTGSGEVIEEKLQVDWYKKTAKNARRKTERGEGR